MADSSDPKKLLLPYLQRADELQKHEPLVAYYCRLYAMERGLKIPAKERGKTVNSLLVSLMTQLEKDKKTVKLSSDDNMYVEGFASRVFTKADKQDRAGRADLSTAKTFYASSLFFEVLHQFGEIPPDIEQRQKYAVWKAADVRKALSEGRKPVPGPPGGDEDFSEIDGVSFDTEASPPKSAPTTAAPSSPTQAPQHEDEFPPPGVGHQLPRSESSDPVQRIPSPAPPPQTFHHTRQTSSDDIDLPSAPTTQPVYPRGQNSSPPHYQSDFPSPYAPTHYTPMGPDTGAPPPPIHDWSGSNARTIDGQYSSSFGYPPSSHDEYNAHAPNYSSFPSNSPQSPHVNPTDQGFSYSQYPSPPTSEYQAGAQYPSVSPSQNSNAGYTVSPQHHRVVSAPVAPPATSGYSNGTYPSDNGYQPTPDKIAEAHKAARFAVSSLAFDDVPTALEFLRKSLELLTVPSRAV